MKKKIAVFANGWSDEYIQTVLLGVRECAEEHKVDVYVFIDFSTGVNPRDDASEANIAYLPDLQDFDGVMLLANTFNLPSLLDDLCKKIKQLDIPAITLEYETNGLDYLGTENYDGMYELTSHMIEVHGAKDILFVAGQKEHEESKIRQRAVADAMKAHGLELTEDRVIYGLFSDMCVQEILPKWIEQNGRLPESIICANDIMAMGACFWLQKQGYKVPEDVTVTGYDYVKSAQLCYPSITSVARDWDRLGYKGMIHLLDKIDGKPVVAYNSMKSHFVAADSCGCRIEKTSSQRESIFYSAYGKKRELNNFDNHNRALWTYTGPVHNYRELQEICGLYYQRDHAYEGNNFAICTEPDYWDEKLYGTEILRHGYSQKLSLLCGLKDGKAIHTDTMVDTKKGLVPLYEEDEKGHIFLFVPLYYRRDTIAYTVFQDQENIMESGLLFNWTRYLNQTLMQAKQTIHMAELNKRLEELSVTDALTGIYNRMGYEKFALPYLEECRVHHTNGVMVFADINHMKTINDKYGHLQGDIAICATASALKKALPQEWIAVRYGGDEFLAAGSFKERVDLKQLEAQVRESLAKEIAERGITFDLSVSIGAVWVDGDSTLSIEECFKQADQSMYMMKKEVHEKEAKEKEIQDR